MATGEGLVESPPFAQGDITPGEAETINRLTETRLFSSSFEQLPTQGVMLNLSPPSAWRGTKKVRSGDGAGAQLGAKCEP